MCFFSFLILLILLTFAGVIKEPILSSGSKRRMSNWARNYTLFWMRIKQSTITVCHKTQSKFIVLLLDFIDKVLVDFYDYIFPFNVTTIVGQTESMCLSSCNALCILFTFSTKYTKALMSISTKRVGCCLSFVKIVSIPKCKWET